MNHLYVEPAKPAIPEIGDYSWNMDTGKLLIYTYSGWEEVLPAKNVKIPSKGQLEFNFVERK